MTGDRYPQVKSLRSVGALRTRLDELGVDIPVADDVDAGGPLATPVSFTDASAGTFTAPNRFAVLPMEGWDGSASGAPTDLVRRRWERFGHSGAGLVWGEATAVRHDGRANPRQLVIDETTVAGIAELRARLDPAQVVGLQLTHSGRWCRPDGTPAPRTAYAHPLLDARVGAVRVGASHRRRARRARRRLRARGRARGRGGLRLRRREALPRLPAPRAAVGARARRPVRR